MCLSQTITLISNAICRGHFEEFEDTKVVIRFRKSNKDRQYNGQEKKDKQRYTKQYTDN
jgi:hypothetical protein